jgi:hypothetical protein
VHKRGSVRFYMGMFHLRTQRARGRKGFQVTLLLFAQQVRRVDVEGAPHWIDHGQQSR